MAADHPIPVIDLFAGPGGLGEGFSALGRASGRPRFKIGLSIEKDPIAHQTLELRAFFRQFPHGEAPAEYYTHLQTGGRYSRGDLFAAYAKQADAARREAQKLILGVDDPDLVRGLIKDALRDEPLKNAPSDDRWVLIGGPPCQAYSNAGRSRNSYRHRNKYNVDYDPAKDPRQYLYVEYLQVIADHRPAVFVMENVKGLLSATLDNELIFSRILEDLHAPAVAIRREGRKTTAGKASRYRIYSLEQASMFGECPLADFVVRSERHGIPQARHRIILLGVRDELSAIPKTLGQKPVVAARDVLNGLPPLRSGLSNGGDTPEAWRVFLKGALRESWWRQLKDNDGIDVAKAVEHTVKNLRLPREDRGGEFVEWEASISLEPEWFLDQRLGGVCNHATRTHMPRDLHRYLYAACFAAKRKVSPKLSDFPKDLLPEHNNVKDALAGGNFADRFRVQLWSRPSTTVTCHIAKDGHYYIHPDAGQCRSLTVREAARLQTFPDNYYFCGGRTSQYAQVGNAVPPLMARSIAQIVSDVLC